MSISKNGINIKGLEKLLEGVTLYVEFRRDTDDSSSILASEIQAVGAKISKNRSKDVTHVLFNEGTFRTSEWAKKHNIPLVNICWIYDCIRFKMKLYTSPYEIEYIKPEYDIFGFKKRIRYKKYIKTMSIEEYEEHCRKRENRHKKQLDKSLNSSGSNNFHDESMERTKQILKRTEHMPSGISEAALQEVVDRFQAKIDQYEKQGRQLSTDLDNDVANSSKSTNESYTEESSHSPNESVLLKGKENSDITSYEKRNVFSNIENISEISKSKVKSIMLTECSSNYDSEDINKSISDNYSEESSFSCSRSNTKLNSNIAMNNSFEDISKSKRKRVLFTQNSPNSDLVIPRKLDTVTSFDDIIPKAVLLCDTSFTPTKRPRENMLIDNIDESVNERPKKFHKISNYEKRTSSSYISADDEKKMHIRTNYARLVTESLEKGNDPYVINNFTGIESQSLTTSKKLSDSKCIDLSRSDKGMYKTTKLKSQKNNLTTSKNLEKNDSYRSISPKPSSPISPLVINRTSKMQPSYSSPLPNKKRISLRTKLLKESVKKKVKNTIIDGIDSSINGDISSDSNVSIGYGFTTPNNKPKILVPETDKKDQSNSILTSHSIVDSFKSGSFDLTIPDTPLCFSKIPKNAHKKLKSNFEITDSVMKIFEDDDEGATRYLEEHFSDYEYNLETDNNAFIKKRKAYDHSFHALPPDYHKIRDYIGSNFYFISPKKCVEVNHMIQNRNALSTPNNENLQNDSSTQHQRRSCRKSNTLLYLNDNDKKVTETFTPRRSARTSVILSTMNEELNIKKGRFSGRRSKIMNDSDTDEFNTQDTDEQSFNSQNNGELLKMSTKKNVTCQSDKANEVFQLSPSSEFANIQNEVKSSPEIVLLKPRVNDSDTSKLTGQVPYISQETDEQSLNSPNLEEPLKVSNVKRVTHKSKLLREPGQSPEYANVRCPIKRPREIVSSDSEDCIIESDEPYIRKVIHRRKRSEIFGESRDDFVITPDNKNKVKSLVSKKTIKSKNNEIVILGLSEPKFTVLSKVCSSQIKSSKFVVVNIVRCKEQLVVISEDNFHNSYEFTKALIYGNVFVSKAWLDKCIEKKKWIDHTPYLIGEKLFKKIGVIKSNRPSNDNSSFSESENLVNKNQYLLSDYCPMFISSTGLQKIQKYKLRILIESNGGQITESFRNAGIVIGTRKANALSVKEDWILDSISNKRMLDPEHFQFS